MANFLERLLGKKNSIEAAAQTAPLQSAAEVQETTETLPALQPGQYQVGCGQSAGKQRDHNEDTLFVSQFVLAGETESLPMGVFIIADGMGGHQHGEAASLIAAQSMADTLMQKLILPKIKAYAEQPTESVQEVLKSGIDLAQAAVVREVPGGGTTLTTAFCVGDQVSIAHVGDSRAYFIHSDGKIDSVTRDHSLVRRLQELGQLTEKEASEHPQRNVLYRAIGQGEPFEPDIKTMQFPRPGSLLICSDGLWGVVDEAEIARIVQSADCPSFACQQLIKLANEAGGPDNISAILIQYPI